MKNIIANLGVAIAIIALGFGAITLLKNDGTDSGTAKKSNQVVMSSAWKSIQSNLDNGAILLDVRTAEEYNARHAKDAILWPVQDMQAGRLPDGDKAKKLYVYCRSGNRSAQATEILQQAGFTNITDLGGIASLEKMGTPMVGNGRTL